MSRTDNVYYVLLSYIFITVMMQVQYIVLHRRIKGPQHISNTNAAERID